MNLAAIDIGSNALRLQIFCSQSPSSPKDFRIPLKSGVDVFETGRISAPTERQLTLALLQFRLLMEKWSVGRYRACATSAYRDAENGAEVVSRVSEATSLKVEIISGQEEARLTRLSYQMPKEWAADYLLFADVGGGSTELSLLRAGELVFSRSFQIGSMRYLCHNQDSAAEAELDKKVREISESIDSPLHLIGIGGSIRFLRKWLDPTCAAVDTAKLERLYNRLLPLSPKEITSRYGVPTERADILLPAASIYLRIAKGLNAKEVQAPDIGVRYGIIASLRNEK